MKYDFKTVHSRKGTGSNKWNGMYEKCPNLSEDIVPFSVADMEFANPPQIAEGVAEYLKHSILGYTSPTESYYDAVIRWMKRRHQWEIKKEWIVDYPGVVPALYHLVRLFSQPGEGIILFTPVYYPFYSAVESAGRTLVNSELILRNGRYEINFEDFEKKAADEKNRICILCNPHNPVGRVWTKEELEKVGEICAQNGVLVISDEIHNDLILPGYEHTVFASISEKFADNSITCTAPSKTFNTAGLMTSNLVISNPKLMEKVKKFRSEQAIFSCNVAGYKACEIAYNECEDWLDELLKVLDINQKLVKNFLEQRIPEIRVFDLEGTYLQWLDCRALQMSVQELEKFMVTEAQIFADEGYMFGACGEGFERWNLACPTAVVQNALDRLANAWDNKKK